MLPARDFSHAGNLGRPLRPMGIDKISAFLVDDQAMVRAGLRALLAAQPDIEVIGEAGDGRTAQIEIARCPPRIAVLDPNLPDMSGLELVRWLSTELPGVGIVAIPGHDHDDSLKLLLQAGARGYLLKRAAAAELFEAIRKVAAGLAHVDPALTGQLIHEVARHGEANRADAAGILSAREAEVGCLLARGYSNKEIAGQLDVSVKTIETHKSRLMDKLDLHNRVDLVRFAVKIGWLQKELVGQSN